MSEYIEQKVKAWEKSICPTCYHFKVCRAVDNQPCFECNQYHPAADVVEVKHSKWKYYHKQNIAVCMNCSFERDLDANFGKAIYCPNCGAIMDGGKDNG